MTIKLVNKYGEFELSKSCVSGLLEVCTDNNIRLLDVLTGNRGSVSLPLDDTITVCFPAEILKDGYYIIYKSQN